MTKMTTYQNTNNEDCVLVDNEDGTTWSGLKSAYDTLASESANDSKGNKQRGFASWIYRRCEQ